MPVELAGQSWCGSGAALALGGGAADGVGAGGGLALALALPEAAEGGALGSSLEHPNRANAMTNGTSLRIVESPRILTLSVMRYAPTIAFTMNPISATVATPPRTKDRVRQGCRPPRYANECARRAAVNTPNTTHATVADPPAST
jgi:hypothetical protein